jgi:UrcA family protein
MARPTGQKENPMFTKIMKSRSLLVVAALGAFAAVATPALADSTTPDGDSVSVSMRDLDLNHDAGAQVALQRIRAAAHEVCGIAPQITDLTRDSLYRSCVNEAIERSVQTLGAAKVTALLGVPATAETLAYQH